MTADASAVTTDIDQAVGAADTQAEVTADASAVTTSVDDAIGAADAPAVVTADTTAIPGDIDQAVSSASPSAVPVDADTSHIDDSIDSAVANASPPPIEIEADTSQAEDAIAGLGETAGEASGGLSELGGGGKGAAEGIGLIGPAAGLAVGEMGGLRDVASSAGPELGALAGATLGVVAAGKGLFDAALNQQTALERLNRTFGATTDAVSRVDVGGLDEDISSLALRTGSADEGLQNFAATFGQLGISAGVAAPQVANTTDQIIALATRASVLNPTLGSSDEIVGRLANGLARGGRFLGQFSIALTTADVNARALADTGKSSASELTVYEKSAAGAALATEKLGDQLGKDIGEGAASDAIKLRSLKTALDEAFERAGANLVGPTIAALSDLEPVLENVTELFGTGLTIALRAAGPALKEFGEEAKTVTDILRLGADQAGQGGFGGVVGDLGANLLQQLNPLHTLSGTLKLAHGDFEGFARGLPAVGAAIDIFAGREDDGAAAARKLSDVHKTLNADLNANAHQSLISAVSAGQLSREIEVAAIKLHTAKDGTVDWAGVLGELQPQLNQAGLQVDQLGSATAKVSPVQAQLASETQRLAEAQLLQLTSSGRLTNAQLETNLALHTAADGTIDYSAALKDLDPTTATNVDRAARLNAGLGEVQSGFNKANDAADRFKTALDQALGIFITADEATLGLAKSEDAVANALADSSNSLDIHTAKGQAAEAATLDLVKAVRDQNDAITRESNGSITAAQSKDNLIAKLREEEERYPGLKAQIEGYIAHILAIPPEQLTNTGLPNAPGSVASADAVSAAVRSIPQGWTTDVIINAGQAFSTLNFLEEKIAFVNRLFADARGAVAFAFRPGEPGFRPPDGRMAGGPVWPGVWTVGEAGPETLVLGNQGSGFVIPNSGSSEAPTSAGGISAADLKTLGRMIARALAAQRPITVISRSDDPVVTATAVSTRVGADAMR